MMPEVKLFNQDINGPGNPSIISNGGSSKLFDHVSSSTIFNGKTIQKISSVKDLLRLFRVNLGDDGTFIVNGQPYLLDISEHKNNKEKQDQSDSEYMSANFPSTLKQDKQLPADLNDDHRETLGNALQIINKPETRPENEDTSQKLFVQGFGRQSLIDIDQMLLGDQTPIGMSNNKQAIFPGIITIEKHLKEDVDRTVSNEMIFKKYHNNLKLVDKEIQVRDCDFHHLDPLYEEEKSQIKNLGFYTQKSATLSNQSMHLKCPPPLVKCHSNISGHHHHISNSYAPFKIQESQVQYSDQFGNQDVLMGQLNLSHCMDPTHLMTCNSANQPPLSNNFFQTRQEFKDHIMSNHRHNDDELILSKTISELTPATLRKTLSMGEHTALSISRAISNKHYIEALQQQNIALQRQLQENNKIGKAKQEIKGSPHLVFLFATPLVVDKGSFGINKTTFKEKYKSQALLEFKKELKGIKDSLSKTQKNIRVSSMQATVGNFTSVLSQKPLALHFTGHGFSFLNTSSKVNKRFLMLEQFDGLSEEMSEEQLRALVKNAKIQFDFVFVASCESEFAGRVFQNIGVKHVIVVKQGNNILDQAVILFSQIFYEQVFQGTNTVCDSFRMAKDAVNISFGPDEARKFTMLTHTELLKQQQAVKRASIVKMRGDAKAKVPPKKTNKFRLKNMPDIEDDAEFNIELDGIFLKKDEAKPAIEFNQEDQFDNLIEEIKHECEIFGPFENGQFETLDEEPFFQEIPSYVEGFIGRQIEMFEVIHSVMRNRLVNIIGLPGIGKTALAKNAVHYINDRRLFKLGIIFFSCKGYKNSNVFMKKLVSNILINNMDLNPEQKAKINDGNQETLINMIITFLKKHDDQLLVVFDNAEELIYHDKLEFRKLVTELLERCPPLKFLMTSRVLLGSLQDIHEKTVLVEELETEYSIKLFTSRARIIDDQEKEELNNYKPEYNVPIRVDEQLDQGKNISNFDRLFKLLSGNPHAIILAAPLLHKKKLKDLYMMLDSPNLAECLAVDGVTDSTVGSLVRSLEVSVAILQNEDKYSLQFFYMIGLLPGGVYDYELKELWKKQGDADKGWEAHVETLMNLSLLQLKEQAGDLQQKKYILPPFINTYAEQTIDPELKSRFQASICQYYVNFLYKIYREDFKLWAANYRQEQNLTESTTSGDVSPRPEQPDFKQLEQNYIKEQRRKMIKHETNIWACIYRMSKTELPIQFDQLEPLDQTLNAKRDQGRRKSTRNYIKQNNFTIQQLKHRKKSYNDALLDDAVEMQQLKLSQKSKSVHDDSKILGLSSQKKPLIESYDDDLNQVAEEDRQDLKQNIDFSQIIQKSNLNNRSQMPSIPEEDRMSSSMNSSSYNKDDDKHEDFVKISMPKGSQPEIKQVEEKKPQNRSILRKIADSIKDNVISTIQRHSIVNFKRSSTLMGKAKQPLQDSISKIQDEEEKKASNELENDDIYIPQPSRSQYDNLTFFNNSLQATMSTPNQVLQRSPQSMTDPEKLISYYSMILYLHQDYDNALKLINKYAQEINGGLIYQANLSRIQGLIHFNKMYIDEAVDAFKKSEREYLKAGSDYGRALSHYSIGIIMQNYSKLLNKPLVQVQFSLPGDDFSQNENPLRHFQIACDLFSNGLNHKAGISLCHMHLSQINKQFGNLEMSGFHSDLEQTYKKHFTKYLEKSRKHCVYVSRQYGQDISLMTEIVKDTDKRDLFPEVAPTSHSSNSLNSSFKIEYLKNRQTSNTSGSKYQHGNLVFQPLVHQSASFTNQYDGNNLLSQLQMNIENKQAAASQSSKNQVKPFKYDSGESSSNESPPPQSALMLQKSLGLLNVVHEEDENDHSHLLPEDSHITRGERDPYFLLPKAAAASADRKIESSQDLKNEHEDQLSPPAKISGPKTPTLNKQSRKSAFQSIGEIGISLFQKIGNVASGKRSRKNTL